MSGTRRVESAWARLFRAAVTVADRVVPPRSSLVIVHSVPDVDDNVVALLHSVPAGVRVAYLADHPEVATRRLRAFAGDAAVRVIPKRSLRAAWLFVRSTAAIGTHGLFGSKPRRRGKRSVGVWHGDPVKLVGAVIGEPTQGFDVSLVSSNLARPLRALEFGVPLASVVATGTPRLERLGRTGRPPLAAPGGKLVVWLPTYREAVRGVTRQDGVAYAGALPFPGVTAEDLLRVLRPHGAQLWIRAHPLAVDLDGLPAQFRSASDDSLESLGLTLYELLGQADLLITDYSSVWIDFLHVDRPVVGSCYDLDEYRRSRPLGHEPYEEWFPGPVCRDAPGFLAALDAALADPATGAERRRELRWLLSPVTPAGISERVWRLALAGTAGERPAS